MRCNASDRWANGRSSLRLRHWSSSYVVSCHCILASASRRSIVSTMRYIHHCCTTKAVRTDGVSSVVPTIISIVSLLYVAVFLYRACLFVHPHDNVCVCGRQWWWMNILYYGACCYGLVGTARTVPSIIDCAMFAQCVSSSIYLLQYNKQEVQENTIRLTVVVRYGLNSGWTRRSAISPKRSNNSLVCTLHAFPSLSSDRWGWSQHILYVVELFQRHRSCV